MRWGVRAHDLCPRGAAFACRNAVRWAWVGLRGLESPELANDVLEIVTVSSARLYGSRSYRNQKLIDGVRKAVKEAQ